MSSILFLLSAVILIASGIADVNADPSSVQLAMLNYSAEWGNEVANAMIALVRSIGWVKISGALILLAFTDGLKALSLITGASASLKGRSLKSVFEKINNAGLDQK